MRLRVAAVQMEHKDADINYNFSIVEKFTKEAVRNKADVVVFPECCMIGYMFLDSLSVPELLNIAQPLNGSICEQITELAKKYKVVLSVGMLEKDDQDNIYNTYLTIGPQGLLSSFRKIHPFVNDALKAGNEYSVFDLNDWKASTLICYDNNLPENCRMVSLLGAEILFAPHQTGGFDYPHAGMGLIDQNLWQNRDKDPQSLRKEFLGPKGRQWLMKWLPCRAYDNALYVVYANGVGIDGPKEIRTGNSCIIDPHGIILAESNALGDDMVIADCYKEEIGKALGKIHDRSRRPSLYRIICEGDEGKTRKIWENK